MSAWTCPACGRQDVPKRHCKGCPWVVCPSCGVESDPQGRHNCGAKPKLCVCQRGDQ